MLSSIKFRIENYRVKRYWRKHNRHNSTWIGSISNIEAARFVRNGGITVGKRSYGKINVNYTMGKCERLEIGSNCSLGRCEFLLGGGHDYECLSTFPFGTAEATSKGPIVVEDDVWIGDAVWVLSGVRIGKGSVIGTGSIVTHDIPPYAVVAGNPARVIKYRFPEEIINKLKTIDLDANAYTEEQIALLSARVTSDNLPEILAAFPSREEHDR